VGSDKLLSTLLLVLVRYLVEQELSDGGEGCEGCAGCQTAVDEVDVLAPAGEDVGADE